MQEDVLGHEPYIKRKGYEDERKFPFLFRKGVCANAVCILAWCNYIRIYQDPKLPTKRCKRKTCLLRKIGKIDSPSLCDRPQNPDAAMVRKRIHRCKDSFRFYIGTLLGKELRKRNLEPRNGRTSQIHR